MLPRVVLRLDELIAQADSPLDRECLKAERAGVLARLGLMADARFAWRACAPRASVIARRG
jgi:hypothetical protein